LAPRFVSLLFALLADVGDPCAALPAQLEAAQSDEAALVCAFFGAPGIERRFAGAVESSGCVASALERTRGFTGAIPLLPDAVLAALISGSGWRAFADWVAADAGEDELPRVAGIVGALRARRGCPAAARAALRLAAGATPQYVLAFEHVWLEAEDEVDEEDVPCLCTAIATAAAAPAKTQRIIAAAVPRVLAFFARRSRVEFSVEPKAVQHIADGLAGRAPPETAAQIVDFAAAFAAASAKFGAAIRARIEGGAFRRRGHVTAAIVLLWTRMAVEGGGGDEGVCEALEVGHRQLARATPDRFTDDVWRVSKEWAVAGGVVREAARMFAARLSMIARSERESEIEFFNAVLHGMSAEEIQKMAATVTMADGGMEAKRRTTFLDSERRERVAPK
jgi:NAD(P)H-dependent FMN reductase